MTFDLRARLLGWLVMLGAVCALCPACALDHEPRSRWTLEVRPGVLLRLETRSFDSTQRKIHRCTIVDWEGVCLIDGRPVFGTDWELPTSELVAATVVLEGTEVALDVSCMFDPWADQPRTEQFLLEEAEGGYGVRGHLSDGAGSYDVEWFVIQGASVRTKLVKGEC
jgi:hypothetical protein